MKSASSPRIFIGSGEASVLERKTLIWSLHKHSGRGLDIHVFNGTHNAVEHGDDEPVPAPMSLRVKYRNITEFSNYRFLIPQLCGHEGRAIWLDSDMVCLTDIRELFDTPMDGFDLLACPDAYGGSGSRRWGLSVALFDCSRCHFDLDLCFDEIDQGRYSYGDLHQLSTRFLEAHPLRVGSLDANWNVFDRHDRDTRLIHYTNLFTQPWKFRGHPWGDLWHRYFNEARSAGYITEEDLQTAFVRAYARRDLLDGHAITPGYLAREGWRALRAMARRAARNLR